jgi:lysozyme
LIRKEEDLIMTMKTSAAGRAAISVREGAKLTAYRDSAGVLTIGVGHTSAAGAPTVTAGMRITAAEADKVLSRDLAAVEVDLNRMATVPLNQNEFDALVSLVFNIGATAFRKSTLLRRLNAGDRRGAADQFLAWNKITRNGRKVELRGLTTRRQAERGQFLTPAGVQDPVPASPVASPPKSVPADPVPETRRAAAKLLFAILLLAVAAVLVALGIGG